MESQIANVVSQYGSKCGIIAASNSWLYALKNGCGHF